MLTGSVDSAHGAVFKKASKESGFGQVFENNMDSNSFNRNNTLQIELTLSNSQYALFHSCATMRKTKAYENCQVENQL